MSIEINELRELIASNARAIESLTEDIRQLRDESKELSTRFGHYQQSTQAVINLAFSLVASATVSIFITTILKR